MTPDVNVLVAAFRPDHSCHVPAAQWLRTARAEAGVGRTLDVLPMVAAGFLRLTTHPKVFSDPAPIAVALAFLDALLDSPGVRMTPLGGEWLALRQLCASKNLAGNDVPDAWIAAAAKSTGLHLVTFDRDFARLLDATDFTLLKVPLKQHDVALRTPDPRAGLRS